MHIQYNIICACIAICWAFWSHQTRLCRVCVCSLLTHAVVVWQAGKLCRGNSLIIGFECIECTWLTRFLRSHTKTRTRVAQLVLMHIDYYYASDAVNWCRDAVMMADMPTATSSVYLICWRIFNFVSLRISLSLALPFFRCDNFISFVSVVENKFGPHSINHADKKEQFA